MGNKTWEIKCPRCLGFGYIEEEECGNAQTKQRYQCSTCCGKKKITIDVPPCVCEQFKVATVSELFKLRDRKCSDIEKLEEEVGAINAAIQEHDLSEQPKNCPRVIAAIKAAIKEIKEKPVDELIAEFEKHEGGFVSDVIRAHLDKDF